MRKPPTQSKLRKHPILGRAPHSVNYLEGYWIGLSKDGYVWAVFGITVVLRAFKRWLKKKDRTITIRIRWVLAGLLLLALWPHPHKIVYGDPISPAPAVHKIALIKPIAQTPLEPVATAEPVQVAPVVQTPVVAPPVASGCQTYWSGDYYLDNIIRYESGGNSCATNYLGCFGLLQACPGAPLRDACGGDPACQISWFQANKTGGRSWAQVWQHELDYGWW